MRVVACLLAFAALARADDTAEQAAAKVAAAVESGDHARVAALAARSGPDPWLVADTLLEQGKAEAALVFAKATPDSLDTRTLADYVAARAKDPTPEAMRAALAAAAAALGRKDGKGVLAAIGADPPNRAYATSYLLHYQAGSALNLLRRYDEARQEFQHAADTARALGWTYACTRALFEAGRSAYFGADYRAALGPWEALVKLHGERRDEELRSNALTNLGLLYQQLHDLPRSIATLREVLAIKERRKDDRGIAVVLTNLGGALKSSEQLDDAQACYERALEIGRRIGHRELIRKNTMSLGLLLGVRARFHEAARLVSAAIVMCREDGDERGLATALGQLLAIHLDHGRLARALTVGEEALAQARKVKNPNGVAIILTALGEIHADFGNFELALKMEYEALRISERYGFNATLATALTEIARVHRARKEYDRALAMQERAVQLARKLGRPAKEADALGNLATILREAGQHDRAWALYEKSLAQYEAMGAQTSIIDVFSAMGDAQSMRGNRDEALRWHERSLALAARYDLPFQKMRAHLDIATEQLYRDEPEAAMKSAYASHAQLGAVLGGLAQAEGTGARTRWSLLYRIGMRAAGKLDRPDDFCFFLENGRAGSLLEAIGSRRALGADLLEPELHAAFSAARAEVARRQRAHQAGPTEETRARLDDARLALERVVARIQRDQKAAADVLYPRATPLREIRSWLRASETLVLYAHLPDTFYALVVSAAATRIVELGEVDAIEGACAALDFDADPSGALATLRKLVVEPLALGDDTRRLLISPHGALTGVPFALLAPGRETAYVPSATTYGALATGRGERGDGVLGLGDPDYGTEAVAAVGLLRGGRKLVPLPATRKEVSAISDVALLGKDATEAQLRAALAKRKRWRAVHLACHGIVDLERPAFSSLALTADGQHDGLLTTLDVFRLKTPADLVVLSACDTARGKFYRGEGVVGMKRAFMSAGAPRVIASLWKVDDEATRALMVKFYELWRKYPTATALKKAQEFVAGREKWKHPRFWAAWQLWGLPD